MMHLIAIQWKLLHTRADDKSYNCSCYVKVKVPANIDAILPLQRANVTAWFVARLTVTQGSWPPTEPTWPRTLRRNLSVLTDVFPKSPVAKMRFVKLIHRLWLLPHYWWMGNNVIQRRALAEVTSKQWCCERMDDRSGGRREVPWWWLRWSGHVCSWRRCGGEREREDVARRPPVPTMRPLFLPCQALPVESILGLASL